MNQNNEIEVIENIKRGDVSAFGQLVERYQSMAFSLALQIVKSREDAEEVVQDAFVKAYKALESFKGDAAFSTWLYRIVYNTAISKTRGKRLDIANVDEANVAEERAEDSAQKNLKIENKDRKVFLKKALSRLKEQDAFMLTLYYYKELPVEEISQIVGLSVSNVKVKLHRGRKRMYNELEKLLKHEVDSLL